MGRANGVGDAILLAGGLGTRLQSVSGGVPKLLMRVGYGVFLMMKLSTSKTSATAGRLL
jgi:choline kinase